MSGKQKFSFQYDRKLVVLSRRKFELSFFFNTRNLGGMILLTRSVIVFMLRVTNLLKEYLASIHGKLDVYLRNIYIFIVIALDETSILVTVQFSMQNIYESCDLGRALWRSNVDVHQ